MHVAQSNFYSNLSVIFKLAGRVKWGNLGIVKHFSKISPRTFYYFFISLIFLPISFKWYTVLKKNNIFDYERVTDKQTNKISNV